MEDSTPIYAEKCGFGCIHPTEWSVGGTGRPLPALPADVPRFNLTAIHAFGSMESGWSGFDRVCLLLLKKQSKAGPVQTGRLGIARRGRNQLCRDSRVMPREASPGATLGDSEDGAARHPLPRFGVRAKPRCFFGTPDNPESAIAGTANSVWACLCSAMASRH